MKTEARPSAEVLRERRAVTRARQLAELLERRPDLFGVHSAADLAADSVRWSA